MLSEILCGMEPKGVIFLLLPCFTIVPSPGLTDRSFSLSHNNPVSPNIQVLFPSLGPHG
jgi:hypothetical protein